MIHRPHVSLHLQMQTRGPEWRRSYVDQIHFTKANLVYLLGSFLTAHYGRFLPSLSYILATYWPIILMNPSHHPLCCFGTVSAAASLSRRESPRAMIIFGTSSEYEEAWAERRASDRLHSFKNSAPKSSNGILKGWKWSIVDTIHYHGLHTIGRFGVLLFVLMPILCDGLTRICFILICGLAPGLGIYIDILLYHGLHPLSTLLEYVRYHLRTRQYF